jgi:hypothetical protein
MHAKGGDEECEKNALDECGKKQPEECTQRAAMRNARKTLLKIQKH